MIEQKEKQVLAELIKFGYDRIVIALTDTKGKYEVTGWFDISKFYGKG